MITFKEFLTESTKTTNQAKDLGLTHHGKGRWGINGRTIYTADGGNLTPYHDNAASVHPSPKDVDKKDLPKKNKKEFKRSQASHVYEDQDNMVISNSLDQKSFKDTYPSRGDTASLYMQVLHNINMKLETDPKEIMTQFNPAGDYSKGMNLPDLILGFAGVDIDGKKIDVKLVQTPTTIDEALGVVKSGDPVICMIDKRGGIGAELGKERGKDPYHALMLIGHDKASDAAVFRDSDFRQVAEGSNGMIKVPVGFLRSHKNSVLTYMVLDVNFK